MLNAPLRESARGAANEFPAKGVSNENISHGAPNVIHCPAAPMPPEPVMFAGVIFPTLLNQIYVFGAMTVVGWPLCVVNAPTR